MRKAALSVKEPGFTKCVSLWMRPEIHRALRLMAADRNVTVQEIVDELVAREAARRDPIVIGPRRHE